jgi:hypothetical protein
MKNQNIGTVVKNPVTPYGGTNMNANQNIGTVVTNTAKPYGSTNSNSNKSPGISRFQHTPAQKQQTDRQPENHQQSVPIQNHQRSSVSSSSICSSSVPPFANRPRNNNNNHAITYHNQQRYQSRASTGQMMNIPLNDITASNNKNLSGQNVNMNGKREMECDTNKAKRMIPYSGSNPYANTKNNNK